MNSLEVVPMDRVLKRDVKLKELRERLESHLNQLPDLQSRRLDNEITSLVCNVVENCVDMKKYGVSKKQFVQEFLQRTFKLTPEEQERLDKQIEYLHSHGLIKRLALSKKAVLSVGWWLKKKFL